MELFGKPTFRAVNTSGTCPGEVIVTFEQPWVMRTEGRSVILRTADGTEFKLSNDSNPKKEALWVPRADSALAPSPVTWSRRDHESEGHLGKQRQSTRWSSRRHHESEGHLGKQEKSKESSVLAVMGKQEKSKESSVLAVRAESATFMNRNDATLTSFESYLEPGSSQPMSTHEHVYSVDALGKKRCLEAPPPPTQTHKRNLRRCIQSGRHFEWFNKWMTPADKSSYTFCCSSDDEQLWRFLSKLMSLNCPIGNEPTAATAGRPLQQHVYRLVAKLTDMCSTGGLLVGSSIGFTKASSFLHIGCACCNASVHFATPYLYRDGEVPPQHVDTINRHLTYFFYGEEPSSLNMCTAERANPGVKHGDA